MQDKSFYEKKTERDRKLEEVADEAMRLIAEADAILKKYEEE